MNKNQRERFKFIDQWSKYVLTHPDPVWSKQQNMIIDSCIKSSTMTREEFLKMKGEWRG